MPENLYHFTSVDAFLSMFKGYSKDNPFITLWASHSLFMNDTSEYVYAEGILRDIMNQFEDEENVSEQESFAYIFQNRKSIFNIDAHKDIPYIVSLTRNVNSAALWDIYARKGCGVAIEFDYDKILKLDTCSLRKCVYCRDSSDFLFDERLRFMLKNCYDYVVKMAPLEMGSFPAQVHAIRAYMMLSTLSPVIKNASYSYEEEYRLFSHEDIVKFRTKGNLILPYKEIKLPIDVIKRIIIGPCLDFEHVSFSVKMFLCYITLENLSKNVVCSEIPYRG